MHTEDYKSLPWDSEFFGFQVGMVNTLELHARDIQSQLANIIQSPPCRLLYMHVHPEDKSTRDYLTRFGAQLVDKRIVFRKKLGVSPSANIFKLCTPAENYVDCGSNDLNDLAFLAGRHSRFRTDPKISETDFQRLYSQWINRSVSGALADKVLITRDQQNIPASVITLCSKGVIGSIGLIAVRTDQQGNGLGSLLINQALEYFSHKLCTTAEVVTQGANTVACKLYDKTGFIPYSSSHTYHLWLPYPSTRKKL